MSVKRIIKRGAQHVAARVGPQRWPGRQPRLLILMYHRVLPADHPDIANVEPGMMVTPGTLDLHMTVLRQHFELLTLSDWLTRRAASKPLPPRACAVTFDDGWRDNADYAFPILQKHQVPATIFLVSDWIGTCREFWPERLARLLNHTASRQPILFSDSRFDWLRSAKTDFAFGSQPPNREQLNQLFLHCKQWGDEHMHQHLDTLFEWLGVSAPDHPTLLDWAQVRLMSDSGLIDFGSHTCRHIRLNASLDAETMANEICRSRQKISDALGKRPQTFCYPNGDHTPDAVKLVRQNYLGAVSTHYGWNSGDTDPYILNRIGLHEDISHDQVSFLARLSGWM